MGCFSNLLNKWKPSLPNIKRARSKDSLAMDNLKKQGEEIRRMHLDVNSGDDMKSVLAMCPLRIVCLIWMLLGWMYFDFAT
ncbi:unnamed protein product [Urochloa humidicola]